MTVIFDKQMIAGLKEAVNQTEAGDSNATIWVEEGVERAACALRGVRRGAVLVEMTPQEADAVLSTFDSVEFISPALKRALASLRSTARHLSGRKP